MFVTTATPPPPSCYSIDANQGVYRSEVATFQHVSLVYFNERCLESWVVSISQMDHNPCLCL